MKTGIAQAPARALYPTAFVMVQRTDDRVLQRLKQSSLGTKPVQVRSIIHYMG